MWIEEFMRNNSGLSLNLKGEKNKIYKNGEEFKEIYWKFILKRIDKMYALVLDNEDERFIRDPLILKVA